MAMITVLQKEWLEYYDQQESKEVVSTKVPVECAKSYPDCDGSCPDGKECAIIHDGYQCVCCKSV